MSLDPAERFARLRLARTDRIGPVAFTQLIGRYGSALGALDALPDLVRKSGAASVPLPVEAVERELVAGDAIGARLLVLGDLDYPEMLAALDPPPPILWTHGHVDLLNQPSVAIVGARIASAGGQRIARGLAQQLGQAGHVVVSGMARGIDAAAHEGTLDCNGDTIAVIGTGNDRIYPARNRELAITIAERGCIISEFPLGTPVAAANFPRRNRLISGLARGVLVVEASVDSGSLITARLAAEQGREVCAIPGSIHSPQSRGCHKLLKQGAKLVETAQDVLEELRLEIRLPPAAPAADVAVPNEAPDEARVLALLGYDPCPLDTLVTLSGLTPEALSVMLLRLELGGRIAALPGGRYQRLPSS